MCYLWFYEDLAKVDFRGGKAARLNYPERAVGGGRLSLRTRLKKVPGQVPQWISGCASSLQPEKTSPQRQHGS